MSNEHITDEQIDRICYMATEIRFAKTDEAAQAVIDKIRVALRPAAQPASSTILNKEVLLLLADVRDALGHPDNVALVDRLAYLITGGLPVEWVRRHVKPDGWTDVVIVRNPGRPPKDDERGTWMPRLVMDAGTIELGASAPNIPMPTSEDEAAAMQMLGQAWLQQHAPHRLKAAQPVGEPVAYAVMWGARPMRKHSVHFELPTAEQVAAEVTSNKTMIRPLVFGDTTPQPVAVPDRVPMTDEQMAVLRFLLGESGIDGCHFGDMHPDKRGRFWWRDNLRNAFGITAPSNQPTRTE